MSARNKTSGPNYCLIPRDGSTRLVIYFSGTGKTNGKFDFWGSGRDVAENVLFVSDGRNYWYQCGVPGLGNSIEKTVQAIREICQQRGITDITCVGASMGGYAAILYAALLGGRALAFSFDSILKLPTSPSEKHMPASAPVYYPDIVPIVESTRTPVHIYVGEMYTMDLVGAIRMLHLPSVTVESLRGVDHSSARFVHQRVGLKNVISAIVNSTERPRLREAGTILLNRELVATLHQAHLSFAAGDFRSCIETCRKALQIGPYFEAVHYLIGRAYLSRKKPHSAARHLSMVAAALPDFEDGQFYYAHALRLGGQHFAAEDLLSRQSEKWPKSDRIFYNLAKAQEAIGANTLALSNMEIAVRLRPALQSRMEEMIQRTKDQAETETRAIAGKWTPAKAPRRAKKKSKQKSIFRRFLAYLRRSFTPQRGASA